MTPILYSFRRCPYAMRARLAIKISNHRVELREVVIRDKPQAMLDISPKGTVPVYNDTPSILLEESIDIMRYVLDLNDPENWLDSDTDIAQGLLDECHNFFIPHLNKYKYANRDYGGIDPLPHRAAAVTYLEKLNTHLENKDGLLTAHKGFIDYAIFPFVRQFSSVDRDWFNALPLTNLLNWRDAILDSDLFKSIMKKYPQWQAGDENTYFGQD